MAKNSQINGFTLGNEDVAYVLTRLCAATRELKANFNDLLVKIDSDEHHHGHDPNYAETLSVSFELPSLNEDTAKNEIVIPV